LVDALAFPFAVNLYLHIRGKISPLYELPDPAELHKDFVGGRWEERGGRGAHVLGAQGAFGGVVSKSKEEEPEELRELARRIRVIASALHGAEKTRLLIYARQLEAQAAETVSSRQHDKG